MNIHKTQVYLSTTSWCLLVISLLAGCNLLQRHPESGYAGSHATVKSTVQKSSSDLSTKAPVKPQFSSRGKLQNLENSLGTKKEVEQYSKILPWFKSEDEKIEFLQQNDFEAKQAWLNNNNFMARPQLMQSQMQELVDAQDITVGMPQALVRRSWGEPEAVEVSGNPQFKNERWKYHKMISTSDGYKNEKKVVYFEGGRVVGWELE